MTAPQEQQHSSTSECTPTPNTPNQDNAKTKVTRAKLISTSAASIKKAAARLVSGNLVSFPTETVYGLGCHALDPSAIQRVFQAKERPLTDPLIAHVVSPSDALRLWQAGIVNDDNLEQKALKALAHKFWPGPFTIVAIAAPEVVPSILMANTGYVACRSPSHPIARDLIRASGVPIAAPSANKFGHVSPTRAQHVWDDLMGEDVWILDPTLKDTGNDKEEGETCDGRIDAKDTVVCNVGVESTVAKVEMITPEKGEVIVLRHGAISSKDIRECLEEVGLGADSFIVRSKGFQTLTTKAEQEDLSQNHVAPGQTIRHYSPNVVSYIVSYGRYSAINGDNSSRVGWSKEEIDLLKNAVVIDFGQKLLCAKEYALAYRDLSFDGNSSVAAANVFDTLRWSETVQGAQRVYFPEIYVGLDTDIENSGKGEQPNEIGRDDNDALILAVKDRLTRAASGVIIEKLR